MICKLNFNLTDRNNKDHNEVATATKSDRNIEYIQNAKSLPMLALPSLS